MRVRGKVVRQVEEAKQEEEAAGTGEDLCHPSAYNRIPSMARSPNYTFEYFW